MIENTKQKTIMKTGKVFWQLRLEFLEKEMVSIANTISSLEMERKRLVDYLGDDLTFKDYQLTMEQIRSCNSEIKHQEKCLNRTKARIIECNKNLKVVETANRISYI